MEMARSYDLAIFTCMQIDPLKFNFFRLQPSHPAVLHHDNRITGLLMLQNRLANRGLHGSLYLFLAVKHLINMIPFLCCHGIPPVTYSHVGPYSLTKLLSNRNHVSAN